MWVCWIGPISLLVRSILKDQQQNILSIFFIVQYNVIARVHLIFTCNEKVNCHVSQKKQLNLVAICYTWWNSLKFLRLDRWVISAQVRLDYGKMPSKIPVFTYLWSSNAHYWVVIQTWRVSPCITALPKCVLTKFQPFRPRNIARTASVLDPKNVKENGFLSYSETCFLYKKCLELISMIIT